MQDQPRPASPPTMTTDAEMAGEAITARIVRFDIPNPTAGIMRGSDFYHINMCLTPRPLDSRGGYLRRWGPHRLERLGDIFMVPPGEELRVLGGSGRQASLTADLSPEAIHRLVGQELVWDDQKLATTLDIANARIRALLFRLAEEVRHPGFAAPAMLELLAGELAIEIGRFCHEVHERPVTGGLAGWRLRLIDERLAASAEAPSLADLAALCNLSVRQLTRGFRVSRGCSLGDHIERRRMELAKRRLMSGDSVKAIAFAMGFSSPSSFTYAFRRAVGTSPSNFRKRQLRADFAA